jgi:hypothetical protein
MNEDFIKTERLSRKLWDTCGIALSASYLAVTVMFGSIMMCVTYPPAPLWRIIVCSVASSATFAWMVVALWGWASALDALRAWNDERLDSLERSGKHRRTGS